MKDEKLSVEEIRQRVKPILDSHGVLKAELFGSYASGKADSDSDIDILVEFEDEKNLLDLSSLKLDLKEALDTEVDVMTYDSVHPLIRENIHSEKVEI